MNRFVRRALLGALSGSAAATPLLLLSTRGRLEFMLAIAAGSMYAACIPRARGSYADSITGAASLGIPLWGISSVILLPVLSGNRMALDAAGMQTHFAPLVGWILFGALLGAILKTVSEMAEVWLGTETVPALTPAAKLPRIVILGGGFGGMKAAECLEEELGSSAFITLVSDTNALLFTPMLAEVAGSSLEPSHISVPLRSSLHRTHFVRGRVSGVDFGRKLILLDGGEQRPANLNTIT